MFQHAIVRPPTTTFANGITTADLGTPDYQQALAQHAGYCAVLEACGLTLIRLEPDERYPDSTFVEDTAIITAHGALLTRPGALIRRGEIEAMGPVLLRRFPNMATIEAPGTLDGGDVCQADEHFFIGLSARTNEAGAAQLAAWLATQGYSSTTIDTTLVPGLLHLKTGMGYLGERRLVTLEAFAEHPAFHGYEVRAVPQAESYAANCLRMNDAVLVPTGHPQTTELVRAWGYPVIEVAMSEYQKMDGGLSCLSLRF